MASKALICSASPLVVSNKTTRSQLLTGTGARSFVPRSPALSKTLSKRLSFVVKAELDGGELSKEVARIDPLLPLYLNEKVAIIDTSPYVRAPWNTTEDENEVKMWFDIPGVAATDIDVNVTDNILTIKGPEGVDTSGRKIYSPFDCTLELPFNCSKEETQAVLKYGVLYISVPKISKMEQIKFIHVPVRAA